MAMTDTATVGSRTEAMAGNAPQKPTGASGAPFGDQAAQQASPEEQALYDQFVGEAFNMIYDKRMLPGVLEMLRGGGDPVGGLATAAAQVTAKVYASAQKAGQQIPPDVLLHAGTEIYEDLAELSKTAGIKDFSKDKDAFESGYFRALDQYRMMEQQNGTADQGAAKRDLDTLQQMDKSGQLEQMMMGLAERDANGEKSEPSIGGGLVPGKKRISAAA